jgi:hypothetical protein
MIMLLCGEVNEVEEVKEVREVKEVPAEADGSRHPEPGSGAAEDEAGDVVGLAGGGDEIFDGLH